jgi:hypothetical protein
LKLKNTPIQPSSFDPLKEGWEYRTRITINHDKVAGNLTNFPVLISIVYANLINKTQSDGDDILFMDNKDEANPLYHEIEYYDDSSGKLIAWVNIPSLSSTTDTIIYMYYGNYQCASQQNPEKVWDDNYCSVWHMSDLKDSSSNENDGANHGTNTITGKTGDARDFDRNNHAYIDWGDMPEPANSMINTGTFEMWVKPDDQVGSSPIAKDNSGDYEPDRLSYFLWLNYDGKIMFQVMSGKWYPDQRIMYTITNEAYITTGNWQYIAAVVDLRIQNRDQNMDLYYNGVEKDSTKTVQGSAPKYFYDVDLSDESGRIVDEYGTSFYNGVIDEMRISKICRSAEWIETSYNTMNDPSGFFKFGLEKSKQKENINTLILNYIKNYPNLFPILQKIIQRVELQ